MHTFDEMFERATGQQPFPYQRLVATGDQLPEALAVPTGAGKSAAAVLGWLFRRRFAVEQTRAETPRRLVFCLPMRSLVEQTATAAREWIDALGLTDDVSVHMMLGGEVDSEWVMHPERDSIIVGTQDLLVSRALMRGYASTRTRWPIDFALINTDTQWVLDEVQLAGPSLPTSRQLQAFRNEYGTSAPTHTMWMSATLDPARFDTVDAGALDPDRVVQLSDDDLRNPHLAKRMQAAKTLHQLNVDTAAKGSETLIAEAVCDAHEPGSLTLVVVNTVDRAQTLQAALAKHVGVSAEAPQILLLHSRFRPPDRAARFNELLLAAATPGDAGVICVSTQVIEAGVDLSARTLVTDLAPWSSIVQRIGRANRYGEHADGVDVWWIDRDETKEAAPYDEVSLRRARGLLEEHEGVSISPATIPEFSDEIPVYAWLRRRDLLDLFDTSPDVSGADVDIARFVRDGDDISLSLAWRDLASFNNDAINAMQMPGRDELCSVPVAEFRKLVKKVVGTDNRQRPSIWHYDHILEHWRPTLVSDVRPGGIYVAASSIGSYNPERGFDPKSKVAVEPIASIGLDPAADAASQDPDSRTSTPQTIEQHTEDVCDALTSLMDTLTTSVVESRHIDPLKHAARMHDAGKAHHIFQATLHNIDHVDAEAFDPTAVAQLAKSDGAARRRHARPGFRHELASALILLANPPATLDDIDLAVYLIAAHHGKVRVVIRPTPREQQHRDPAAPTLLGLRTGDKIPPVVLGNGITTRPMSIDLDLLQRSVDGPSWAERVSRLRDDPAIGPFRLAWYESLLRIADMRASAHPTRVSDQSERKSVHA